MRVFLYEFVTGGGLHHASPNEPPCGSLLAEASAMVQALATDLAALPEVELVLLHDARLPPFALPARVEVREVAGVDEEPGVFSAAVRESDAVLLIAPEFNEHLARRAIHVEEMKARLISPHSEFVAIA